jgi:hypothetical protein
VFVKKFGLLGCAAQSGGCVLLKEEYAAVICREVLVKHGFLKKIVYRNL